MDQPRLLRAVGLESRFTPAFSAPRVMALLADEIDWDSVNQRLAALRHSGNAFLSEQLRAAR